MYEHHTNFAKGFPWAAKVNLPHPELWGLLEGGHFGRCKISGPRDLAEDPDKSVMAR